MSKFSVKKPLTVFVAVIAILVLGVVAYFRMTPDLLPNMDFPYVLIMTTYPGASPEKVEQEITKPMEQAMSTLDHIQEVTSVSSENVGMVILEFTEGVNMDTVGVDIQQEISQLSADWSDTVGTPYVLKINPLHASRGGGGGIHGGHGYRGADGISGRNADEQTGGRSRRRPDHHQRRN